MPSKSNYFVYKEQCSIRKNYSNRCLEIVKKGFGVLKAVEWFVFAREAHKPDQWFSVSNRDFNGFSIVAFFFKMKGYFTKKLYGDFSYNPPYLTSKDERNRFSTLAAICLTSTDRGS